MLKKVCIFSVIFAIIDQLIKVVISNTIKLNTHIKIIDNVLYLANVHNDGAAFSMFSGNQIMLMVVTIIAIVVIYFLFIKDKKLSKLELLLMSMLYGGIIGNFIDRVIYRYVIDYIEVIIFNYNFPIFNFADTCIVVSIIILLILSFKEDICKSGKSKKTLEE